MRRFAALVIALAACAGSARADVVTFTKLGRVTLAAPGNPLGVVVGDPVRLDLIFDRDFVLGQTPLTGTLPPFTQSGRPDGSGFEARLSVGSLLLNQTFTDVFDGADPRLFADENDQLVVSFDPGVTIGAVELVGEVRTDRLSFFDRALPFPASEVVAAVFDQTIEPPPVPTPPLRDGPIRLLVDDRRTEQLRCFAPERIQLFGGARPPIIRPFAPFADFAGTGGTCFPVTQTSSVTAARMQGTGTAEAFTVDEDGFNVLLSQSISRYKVSFALDSAQPFAWTGRLMKTCRGFLELRRSDFVLDQLITPFAVLRRSDGSEVERIRIQDLILPEQRMEPDDPDFVPDTVGSEFSRRGDLPPGEYELELVADSTGRVAPPGFSSTNSPSNTGCRGDPRDTWAFDFRLGAPPTPMPPPDADMDGVPDAKDSCPLTANADQRDTGGLHDAAPDGIGDACQCGDVTGDGRVAVADAVTLLASRLRRVAARLPQGTCDVDGDGACTPADGVQILRALGRNASTLGEQRCRSARAH